MEITDQSLSREGLQDSKRVPTDRLLASCTTYPSLSDEPPTAEAVRAFRDAMQAQVKTAAPAVSQPAPSTDCPVSSIFDDVKPADFHWESRPTDVKPKLPASLLRHDMESGKAIRNDEEPTAKLPVSEPSVPFAAPAFQMKTTASDPISAPPGSDVASPLNGEVLDRLVTRLLVSSPESGAPAVRLILSDTSVLRGTDITLTRLDDGTLSVSLINDDPALYPSLAAAQARLSAQLTASEKRPVFISIRRSDEDETPDTRPPLSKARRRSGAAFGQF